MEDMNVKHITSNTTGTKNTTHTKDMLHTAHNHVHALLDNRPSVVSFRLEVSRREIRMRKMRIFFFFKGRHCMTLEKRYSVTKHTHCAIWEECP